MFGRFSEPTRSAIGAAGGLLLGGAVILGVGLAVTGSITAEPIEIAVAVVLFVAYVILTYKIEVIEDE